MIRASYVVTVTVPPGMTPEQCGHEVQVSVNFGAPLVKLYLVCQLPDEAPDPVG